MNVFITDASYKHTLAIVRSLGRKNIAVNVGTSFHSAQLSSFSKYSQQSFVYPNPKKDPDGFVRFFNKMYKLLKYEAIIPVGYTTTLALSMKKNLLNDNINIPISDYSSFKIAANKADSILLAKRSGVPIPNTIFLNHPSELENLKIESYPVVVKGIYEGGFVRYAYTKQELKEKFEEIYKLQATPPLIQEFVKGEGYGFFALFNHGKPRAIFMHKRIRERYIMGGPSTCAESVYVPKLLDYGLKLLKTLAWHGVAMVEFKKDSTDGSFKLMEINPKFWGSLDLAIASGVDFPYLLYKMTIDGDVRPVFTYKRGLKFMWPFPDDLLHVLEKPRDIKSFFSDLCNQRVNKNINFNDLKPIVSPILDKFHLYTKGGC